MSCPEHGGTERTPEPQSQRHDCCSVGHNSALPAHESIAIDAPAISIDLPRAQQFVASGCAEHSVTTQNRSETPPIFSPIRI